SGVRICQHVVSPLNASKRCRSGRSKRTTSRGFSRPQVTIAYPQPHGRFVRRCPINPMLLEFRDVDEIAGLHLDHAILELQPRRPLQKNDPLVLRLVVPEVGRCSWKSLSCENPLMNGDSARPPRTTDYFSSSTHCSLNTWRDPL